MKYLSLGDTHEIAASCHHLTFGGTGLVLDAGMDPDKDGWDAVPDFQLLRERPVDHVIVSHAHHDHLGSLPVLMREVPHARVHLSRPTAMLAETLLPSSARLQKRRLREGSTTAAPVFDVETAEGLGHVYETPLLNTPFRVDGVRGAGPLTATFHHAGHVLGAVSVLVEGEDTGPDGVARPRRLYYSGDVSIQNGAILPGAEVPAEPVDVLILESTLGADPEAEATTRKAEETRFGKALADTIRRGGVALVPVFALGRSQDVLAMIDRFKSRGILPDDVPVYTAGSMRGVADVYDKTRTTTPRLNPDFEVFDVEQERLPRSGNKLAEALSRPGIFVVSSGMLFERTPSFDIAQQLVGDARHGVFFVGFSKEGSPGDRLQKAAAAGEQIVFDDLQGPQTVRAHVDRFRFSGHAHRRDLLRIVDALRPQTVVLVHGETAAKAWLRDAIAAAHPEMRVVLPEPGVEVEL